MPRLTSPAPYYRLNSPRASANVTTQNVAHTLPASKPSDNEEKPEKLQIGLGNHIYDAVAAAAFGGVQMQTGAGEKKHVHPIFVFLLCVPLCLAQTCAILFLALDADLRQPAILAEYSTSNLLLGAKILFLGQLQISMFKEMRQSLSLLIFLVSPTTWTDVRRWCIFHPMCTAPFAVCALIGKFLVVYLIAFLSLSVILASVTASQTAQNALAVFFILYLDVMWLNICFGIFDLDWLQQLGNIKVDLRLWPASRRGWERSNSWMHHYFACAHPAIASGKVNLCGQLLIGITMLVIFWWQFVAAIHAVDTNTLPVSEGVCAALRLISHRSGYKFKPLGVQWLSWLPVQSLAIFIQERADPEYCTKEYEPLRPEHVPSLIGKYQNATVAVLAVMLFMLLAPQLLACQSQLCLRRPLTHQNSRDVTLEEEPHEDTCIADEDSLPHYQNLPDDSPVRRMANEMDSLGGVYDQRLDGQEGRLEALEALCTELQAGMYESIEHREQANEARCMMEQDLQDLKKLIHSFEVRCLELEEVSAELQRKPCKLEDKSTETVGLPPATESVEATTDVSNAVLTIATEDSPLMEDIQAEAQDVDEKLSSQLVTCELGSTHPPLTPSIAAASAGSAHESGSSEVVAVSHESSEEPLGSTILLVASPGLNKDPGVELVTACDAAGFHEVVQPTALKSPRTPQTINSPAATVMSEMQAHGSPAHDSGVCWREPPDLEVASRCQPQSSEGGLPGSSDLRGASDTPGAAGSSELHGPAALEAAGSRATPVGSTSSSASVSMTGVTRAVSVQQMPMRSNLVESVPSASRVQPATITRVVLSPARRQGPARTTLSTVPTTAGELRGNTGASSVPLPLASTVVRFAARPAWAPEAGQNLSDASQIRADVWPAAAPLGNVIRRSPSMPLGPAAASMGNVVRRSPSMPPVWRNPETPLSPHMSDTLLQTEGLRSLSAPAPIRRTLFPVQPPFAWSQHSQFPHAGVSNSGTFP